jgi:tetratricopeptide (TPR) repeat protein
MPRQPSTRKRVNFKALVVLVAVASALGVGIHLVHGAQVRRTVAFLTDEAAAAEREGRPGEAADYLHQYLLVRPDDADARARLGFLLARGANSGRAAGEAYVTLSAALRADPKRNDVRREMARLGLRLGRVAEVREYLAELRNAGEGDAETATLQARCEVAEGKFAEASKWYAAAVDLEPKDVATAFEWATLLRERLAAPDRADREVERIVGAAAGAIPARLAAGKYYVRWGNPGKARAAVIDPSGEACSDDPDVLLLATDLALAAPDAAAARRHAERGAARHPGDVRFTLRLARLDMTAGHRDRALAAVRPLVDSPPKDPEAVWALGNLLVDLNELDRVSDLTARLGRSVPLWAPDYLRGRLLMRKGEWAAARNALDKAVATGKLSTRLGGEVLLSVAECWARLGNPDGRAAACRRAVETDPDWPPARRALAAALLALGKPGEAAAEFRILAKGDPAARVDEARALLARNLLLPDADRKWDEFDRLLTDPPKAKRAEAELLRAEALATRGQSTEALRLAAAERDRDPKRPEPWVLFIGLAERGPDPTGVVTLAAEAERKVGPRPEWLLARARHWARVGGPGAAAGLAGVEAAAGTLPADDRDRARIGIGELFAGGGDTAGAERVWRQVAEAHPGDPDIRFRLFGLAVRGGNDARAGELVAEIGRLEGPGGPLTAFGEATLAAKKARAGDAAALSAARTALARAVAARPAWPLAILLEGELHELDGRPDQAADRYRAAVDGGVRSPEVVRKVVELLARQGRYAEAQAALARLPDSAAATGEVARTGAMLALLGAQRSTDLGAGRTRKQALEDARKAVGDGSTRPGDYLWLARMAVLAGDPDEAGKAIRRARDLDRAAPEPWVMLVAFLARTDHKAAEAELETARKFVPADRLPLVLAAGYESLGKTKEAADHYQAYAAARPDDPQALRAVADFFTRTGDAAGAEPALRRLLALGPKVPDEAAAWARRALAVTLVAHGGYPRFREAIALLDQNAAKGRPTGDDERARALILATRPERRKEAIALLERNVLPENAPPDARFLLAQLYDRDDRWEPAKAELRKLLDAAPRSVNALAFYARALVRRGETEAAGPVIDRLAAAGGEPAVVVELRARVLVAARRRVEAARLVLDYARDAGPKAVSAAARLLDDLGLPLDAEPLFRADAAAGKDPLAPLRLAQFLARHGQLPEALDLCEKAWGTCPPEMVGHASVAALRMGRGNDIQAERVERRLTAAADKAPTSIGLMILRAELMQFRQQFDRAAETYRAILTRDPKNLIALNNLAFLVAVKDGRPEEGLELINAALETFGPVPELLDSRAIVLTKAGRPDQAVDDLRQAIALSPSADKQFHLAQAQLAGGHLPEAAAAWRTATRAGLRPEDLHPLEQPDWDKLSREISR